MYTHMYICIYIHIWWQVVTVLTLYITQKLNAGSGLGRRGAGGGLRDGDDFGEGRAISGGSALIYVSPTLIYVNPSLIYVTPELKHVPPTLIYVPPTLIYAPLLFMYLLPSYMCLLSLCTSYPLIRSAMAGEVREEDFALEMTSEKGARLAEVVPSYMYLLP